MLKYTIPKGIAPTKAFNQQPATNRFNLEERVKAVHEEKIKALQKEVVELSLQNNEKYRIRPILKEIKKVRTLLSFCNKKIQSC